MSPRTQGRHTASGLLGGSCGLSVDTDVCLFVQMSLFRAREWAGSGVNRNSGHGVEARCRNTNSLPGALVPRPTSLSSANSGCLHPNSLSPAVAGRSQQSRVPPRLRSGLASRALIALYWGRRLPLNLLPMPGRCGSPLASPELPATPS